MWMVCFLKNILSTQALIEMPQNVLLPESLSWVFFIYFNYFIYTDQEVSLILSRLFIYLISVRLLFFRILVNCIVIVLYTVHTNYVCSNAMHAHILHMHNKCTECGCVNWRSYSVSGHRSKESKKPFSTVLYSFLVIIILPLAQADSPTTKP